MVIIGGQSQTPNPSNHELTAGYQSGGPKSKEIGEESTGCIAAALELLTILAKMPCRNLWIVPYGLTANALRHAEAASDARRGDLLHTYKVGDMAKSTSL